jgi:Fe2+ transport system protein FeoA
MTLDEAEGGTMVKILDINMAYSRVQAIRLGIVPGSLVKVVPRLPKGPVILEIAHRKIAVGRQLAKHVDIEAA